MKQVIKILHVIDNFARGGAPLVVNTIVERTNTQKFEHFICPLRNIVGLEPKSPLFQLRYRNYDPRKIFAIAKFCRKHNIDIIHGHLSKGNICSLLAGFLCSSKIIIHEHGEIFCTGRYFIYRLLLRLFSRKAKRMIAVSKASRQALVEAGCGTNSISVIGNFVDLQRFNPDKYDRASIRKELGIESTDIVIGFAGRLDSCKGIDLLLSAANTLIQTDKRFMVLIVGNGPELEHLQQQCQKFKIADKVRFVGMVDNPAKYMSAFDVAVVASMREAFGMVAIELMAMKVPVIVSNVGGLGELVQNDSSGIVLNSLDADAITAAVRKITSDLQLAMSYTEKAHKTAKMFTVNNFIDSISEIYQQVLAD